MKDILIYDVSLRDGNHAIRHQLSLEQMATYAEAADRAKIPVIEVGHGNGLGASSLQVGECAHTDEELIRTVREKVKNGKVSVHCMPGFATINKDLGPAIDLGVDIVRVACHCTEADITQNHIRFVRRQGKKAFASLMMTHMASKEVLVEECLKMQDYGAESITLMDSAGNYLPSDVKEKISALVEALEIPVGFHAHNNLGMGVANSIAAVEAGAEVLDGSARGFGAGAGNAQIEVMVAVLDRMGYATGVDLYGVLDAADVAEKTLIKSLPTISSLSVVSGMSGVFSGFIKHVQRISTQYQVDQRDIFFELGKRNAVGGQEDLIVDVAQELAEKKGVLPAEL